MAIDYVAIRDALVSVAQSAGHFDAVNSHEPKVSPGSGLYCHVFANGLTPIRAGGLNTTSARLTWIMQVRCSMKREPMDDVDTDCAVAAHTLLAGLSENFGMDIVGVRNIDLLGAHGEALGWRAGYINQDSLIFRVYDVTVPVIVNDAFSQVA